MTEQQGLPEWDFFIAYAGGDVVTAERLYDLLVPGRSVFLDSKTLLPGDDWDRVLAGAQSRSRVTVVLISRHSDQAYYQREEIAAAVAMARATRHRVVPVFLGEPSSSVSVPYGLRLKHGLHLRGEDDIERVADDLLSLLARLDAGLEEDREVRTEQGLQFLSDNWTSSDGADVEWLKPMLMHSSDATWVLYARVTARFVRSELDVERLHRSIARVSMEPRPNRSGAERQAPDSFAVGPTSHTVIRNVLGKHQFVEGFEPIPTGGPSHRLPTVSTPRIRSRWNMAVIFDREPGPADLVRFSTGPLVWTAAVGTQTWTRQAEQTRSQVDRCWLAEAKLDLLIPVLNWPVVSGARFLRGLDGRHTVLEVTIENHSSQTLSLSALRIAATRYTHAIGSGIMAPHWQELHLDWSRVNTIPGETESVDAWTMMGDERIKVAAYYRPGELAGYNDELRVEVPVQVDVDSGRVVRLAVNIHEVPSGPQFGLRPFLRRAKGSEDVRTIADWDKVAVAVVGTEPVYPESFTILSEMPSA